MEVETPLLAPWLIPEPSIDVFASEQRHADGTSRPLWLTPSPELWMKRLAAAGMPRVYQLARCFRNVEEQGPFHRHEFTMLEWYAVGESYHDALGRTEELLAALHAEVERLGVSGAPATRPPLQRVAMARLWQDELGLDPAHASAAELRAAARRLELPAAAGDTWEQLFNRIFLTCIEPRISRDRPVAVLDYPARIPTLAATHDDGVHAMRWELYLAGIEVANCFQEETAREGAGLPAGARGAAAAGGAGGAAPRPRIGAGVRGGGRVLRRGARRGPALRAAARTPRHRSAHGLRRSVLSCPPHGGVTALGPYAALAAAPIGQLPTF